MPKVQTPGKAILLTAGIFTILVFSAFWTTHPETGKPRFHMPYVEAGLTQRQAAEHLLSRFSFGARPEDVDHVVHEGLETWFLEQLEGRLPETELNKRLASYDALDLSNEQVLTLFPRPARLYDEALQAGYIKATAGDDKKSPEVRMGIKAYMDAKGYRPQQDLFRQMFAQKILRATYSENQLHEVMTDFWFNHFNVSLTKNECAPYVPAYERDVIRPHVTGKFQDLLLATAQSPAMLFFLDNFSSMGDNDQMRAQRERMEERIERKMEEEGTGDAQAKLEKRKARIQSQGLNENYAREIMELHTLGVDGGYTQQDVTEAARVLTGWTIYPATNEGPGKYIRKMIDQVGEDRMERAGFVHQGDFLFAMSRHDNREKTVLGHRFPSGGGYQEGLDLLHLLANHNAAAHFISRKIAVRFVSDDPPAALIEHMASTFQQTDGDISELLKTLVSSPEFWSPESRRAKTRSPFEFAISAVRALKADIQATQPLANYIAKMGQKAYYYQAPTGFPDKGAFWINAGSLINRMNFGMDLATHRIPGISFDLVALNGHHEPESAASALATYSSLLLPERSQEELAKRLLPLVNTPNIQGKIGDAAGNQGGDMMYEDADPANDGAFPIDNQGPKKKGREMKLLPGQQDMPNVVAGILIGSPEFQRR